MFNKLLFFSLFFLLPIIGFTQNCALSIKGYVTDSGTGTSLEYVNVLLSESQQGVITDSLGAFQLSNLCPGEYHIVLSHIGCEPQKIFISLERDTVLYLDLEHSVNVLNDVVVVGKQTIRTTQNVESISEQNIADNADENLSNLLESITGVNTLRNGNGIAKPVVHGLYGNRLTILNNGVAQSGQQWGNDHSPEIDPLVANKLSVIKGTTALEYMGSNLGSVILIEPKKIEREPHLHGKASYFFETNGLSHGVNLQLQKYSPAIAWKINGTFKKSGDKQAANYYLKNTGIQENNFAVQLEKSFSEKLSTELYFSTFNTELGVLRGAHIGNLTDLEEAFQREVPFFTEDAFSYTIEAPKQKVNHHLLKIHAKYLIDPTQSLDFTFAGQLNNRKEFDVRRSGRSEIPALSLQQYSYFFEGKYAKRWAETWQVKSGLQFNITDNTNNPETGILPLIPDYLSYETGLYVMATQNLEKSLLEIGLRYDNILQNVVTITNTSPREIVRHENVYHNFSTSAGWTFNINEAFSFSSNVGYGMRNPAINELYSGGLHQGVSGIEEGDIALQPEKSFKTTFSLVGNQQDKISFEALIYYQKIKDYIYLNPQEEVRLTIRGAFPVFKYEQTDAAIYGVDLSGKFHLTPSLYAKASYSYIRGKDVSNTIPLINIPSNNLKSSLHYEFSKPFKVGNKQFENFAIELNSEYVFRQNNLLANQDFVLPPNSYYLLGAKLSTDMQFRTTRLRWLFKVDNLLNVAYRNYLNRQRYFADDLGRSVTLGLSLKF